MKGNELNRQFGNIGVRMMWTPFLRYPPLPYRLEEEEEDEVNEIENLKKKQRKAKEELLKKVRSGYGQIDETEQPSGSLRKHRTTIGVKRTPGSAVTFGKFIGGVRLTPVVEPAN